MATMITHRASKHEIVKEQRVQREPTIDELRKAIPDYCFAPSLFWSFFYLARDLVYIFSVAFATKYTLALPAVQNSSFLYYSTLNLYGFIEGLLWVGPWVIGHDCGHQSFAQSSTVNDVVGWIIHSIQLVPYFAWKSTHKRHHVYANHMDKDVSTIPPRRGEFAKKIGISLDSLDEALHDVPIVSLIKLFGHQTFGFQSYFFTSSVACPPQNAAKGLKPFWRYSHFDPWGAHFRESETWKIFISTVGCIAAAIGWNYVLGGWENFLWWYVLPWTWSNHWMVAIVYLHHMHPDLPKFKSENWTFLRGALATVDRDCGFVGTHFWHNISSDHVAHHLFSRMPHYYLPIATKSILPLLGDLYHPREEFSLKELDHTFRECEWVQDNPDQDVRHPEFSQGSENGLLWLTSRRKK